MHKKWNPSYPLDRKCQTQTSRGQCIQLALEHSNHCASHGGNKGQEAYHKKSLNMYRLAKYQKRMEEFRDHDDVKGLRNEIGILRMMLEDKITACTGEMDLLLAAGPVSDLVMKVERLVSSCHKIENQLGNLLDRQKVQVLASMLLQTVDSKIKETKLTEVQQGDVLSAVAESFLQHLKEI